MTAHTDLGVRRTNDITIEINLKMSNNMKLKELKDITNGVGRWVLARASRATYRH